MYQKLRKGRKWFIWQRKSRKQIMWQKSLDIQEGCLQKMSDFLKMLKKYLLCLKEHSEIICSKYSGFKIACIKAMNSKGEVATLHIDWSENACTRQVQGEKSAYHFEDYINLIAYNEALSFMEKNHLYQSVMTHFMEQPQSLLV